MKNNSLIKSIAAGVFITLGAISYISANNPFIGSFLFTVGLTSVFCFNVDLFTGKCGYLIEKTPRLEYTKYLIWVYLGNLIGCVVTANLVLASGVSREFERTIQSMIRSKLSLDYVYAFYRGLFCGAFMYLAVKGYNKAKNDLIGILIYVLSVMAFIICGFEHSIADISYFALGSVPIKDCAPFIGIVTLGNIVGSNLVWFITKEDL